MANLKNSLKDLAIVSLSLPERRRKAPIILLPSIPLDQIERLTYFILLASIALVVAYQISLFQIGSGQAPFLEGDNYIYMIFAQLSVSAHSFNVSNPYIIYPTSGFFEHPGLYVVPVVLHYLLPFGGLLLDFRLPYLLAILVIYFLPLMIVKRVLQATPLNKAYRYVAYSLILLNFALMQQTEIIEWRGNTFITALQIIMLYLLSMLFIEPSRVKKVLYLGLACVALVASWFMWSAWFVNVMAFVLLLAVFLVYSKLKVHNKNTLYKILVLIIMISISMTVFLEPIVIGVIAQLGISAAQVLHISSSVCTENPLNLGEAQCLNPSTGLYAVCLYAFFSVFMLTVFLYNRMISLQKSKYEYFLVGSTVLMLAGLPLSLVYLRMLQTIAPYLAINYSLGLVGLFSYFSKMGSNRLVMGLMIFIVILSAAYSFYVYAGTTVLLYHLDNPQGLIDVANYLVKYPNSTVLTYYAYSDFLEYYSHSRVYVDTIQELDTSNVTMIDGILNQPILSGCLNLSLILPKPDYIVVSPLMEGITLFENTSLGSMVNDPYAFNGTCGYSLVYVSNDFYLFRKE